MGSCGRWNDTVSTRHRAAAIQLRTNGGLKPILLHSLDCLLPFCLVHISQHACHKLHVEKCFCASLRNIGSSYHYIFQSNHQSGFYFNGSELSRWGQVRREQAILLRLPPSSMHGWREAKHTVASGRPSKADVAWKLNPFASRQPTDGSIAASGMSGQSQNDRRLPAASYFLPGIINQPRATLLYPRQTSGAKVLSEKVSRLI